MVSAIHAGAGAFSLAKSGIAIPVSRLLFSETFRGIQPNRATISPRDLDPMKTPSPRAIATFVIVAAFFPAFPLSAQTPPGYPAAAAPASYVYTPDELQNLVGRVALYPDDLLALILPASTTPLDIVKGQRFLMKYETDKSLKPDPSISPPVLNLLTYPDVINLMGDDLDWTDALGQAVTAQQQDVLNAIQVFRRKAQAAGNLNSDDKQIVVVQQETVQIVPAQPEVIYVPVYQPATVVVAQPAPVVTYAPTAYPVYYNPVATAAVAATVGYIAGSNNAYGVNWYGGGVYRAPYANYANHIQEERMDYANNAREDWQDYGKASREDWQDYSSKQQNQRQNTATSNQAARQQTSTSNQTQRQQSVQNTTSANQTQRQDAAAGAQASSQQSQAARQSSMQQNQVARQASVPQGSQGWQGTAQTRPTSGGQYAGTAGSGQYSGAAGSGQYTGSGQAAAANRAASSSGQRPAASSSTQFGTRQTSAGSGGVYGGASSGARAQTASARGSGSLSGARGGGGGRRR
jgi:hypothetical protein